MKYLYLLASFIFITSCKKCETCEVIKNGQMIESYDSCHEEGINASKEICEASAKMQSGQCICKDKE